MEGIVVKGIGGLYSVKTEDGIIQCKARGKIKHKEKTLVVGDRVEIEKESSTGEMVIKEIFKRDSLLLRPVVANVTQSLAVFALKSPTINVDLLNKFLVLSEFNNLKIVVCFNKLDLASEEDKNIVNIMQKIGYKVIQLRAKEGIGIDELKDVIDDNISVFCGPSGVGKSTIFNKLVGKELMETGEISKKLKRGKHTTRHSELVECGGGLLVDTPGFSSLDITFIEKEELKECFPEFREYEGECKFNNCLHHKEPGCVVKEKVEEGAIDKSRYDFYIKTLEEIIEGRNKKW